MNVKFGEQNYNFNNLIKARKNLKLTQQYMADKIGVTKSAYSKKERGLLTVSLEEAYILSTVIGMSVEELFFQD